MVITKFQLQEMWISTPQEGTWVPFLIAAYERLIVESSCWCLYIIKSHEAMDSQESAGM